MDSALAGIQREPWSPRVPRPRLETDREGDVGAARIHMDSEAPDPAWQAQFLRKPQGTSLPGGIQYHGSGRGQCREGLQAIEDADPAHHAHPEPTLPVLHRRPLVGLVGDQAHAPGQVQALPIRTDQGDTVGVPDGGHPRRETPNPVDAVEGLGPRLEVRHHPGAVPGLPHQEALGGPHPQPAGGVLVDRKDLEAVGGTAGEGQAEAAVLEAQQA